MAVTNCPHCKADVPPGFDAMPVCMMCGGDLNSAPAGAGWASLDTKVDNTRICPACNAEVKSVFVLECPQCNASLAPVGEPVADIEAERQKFEQLVTQAHAEPVAPVAPTPEPVAAAPVAPPAPVPVAPAAPTPEPVKAPEPVKVPEPVAAAPSKPASPELPSFVDRPEPVKQPEPVAARPEPVRQPEPPKPAPAQEGFFAKLLRMLGLKK